MTVSPLPEDDDPRADARLAFARHAAGQPALGLERASTDAGFRSYWRTAGATPSNIVMDSPPDKEDVQPWLRMHALLHDGGVRVPQVLARDVANGFLLLEDLGAQTLLQTMQPDTADAWFDAAIDQLLRLQAIAPPPGMTRYDEALLARELRLFDDWFLQRHLGLELDCATMDVLDAAYTRLIDAALAQPQLLVHRDFMPRNLMPLDDGTLAVLDFQDAVIGPIAYDVLSLFKDAFLGWPESDVARWLQRYHTRALQAGLPVPEWAQFQRDTDWIGIQRHLKVIGIFARLRHRDCKPKYLADVPRFIAYLDAVLPRYRQFDDLHALLRTTVVPALQARAA